MSTTAAGHGGGLLSSKQWVKEEVSFAGWEPVDVDEEEGVQETQKMKGSEEVNVHDVLCKPPLIPTDGSTADHFDAPSEHSKPLLKSHEDPRDGADKIDEDATEILNKEHKKDGKLKMEKFSVSAMELDKSHKKGGKEEKKKKQGLYDNKLLYDSDSPDSESDSSDSDSDSSDSDSDSSDSDSDSSDSDSGSGYSSVVPYCSRKKGYEHKEKKHNQKGKKHKKKQSAATKLGKVLIEIAHDTEKLEGVNKKKKKEKKKKKKKHKSDRCSYDSSDSDSDSDSAQSDFKRRAKKKENGQMKMDKKKHKEKEKDKRHNLHGELLFDSSSSDSSDSKSESSSDSDSNSSDSDSNSSDSDLSSDSSSASDDFIGELMNKGKKKQNNRETKKKTKKAKKQKGRKEKEIIVGLKKEEKQKRKEKKRKEEQKKKDERRNKKKRAYAYRLQNVHIKPTQDAREIEKSKKRKKYSILERLQRGNNGSSFKLESAIGAALSHYDSESKALVLALSIALIMAQQVKTLNEKVDHIHKKWDKLKEKIKKWKRKERRIRKNKAELNATLNKIDI